MRLLVINGPNLNLLGQREPDVYGNNTYESLVASINNFAAENDFDVDVVQSNSEGAIIDYIHNAPDVCDGIVINPGAYTHYSYAIHDALKSVNVSAIEVHLSNISAREEFRQKSVTAPACVGQISGLGFYGYFAALQWFLLQ